MVMFERRAVDPHFLQFALNFFFDVLEPIFFVWTYSLYQLNVWNWTIFVRFFSVSTQDAKFCVFV